MPSGTGGGFGGNGSGGGVGVGGVGFGRDGVSGIGYPPNKSPLLQPLAVNLINVNKTSDKIPVFLIRETARGRGPG